MGLPLEKGTEKKLEDAAFLKVHSSTQEELPAPTFNVPRSALINGMLLGAFSVFNLILASWIVSRSLLGVPGESKLSFLVVEALLSCVLLITTAWPFFVTAFKQLRAGIIGSESRYSLVLILGLAGLGYELASISTAEPHLLLPTFPVFVFLVSALSWFEQQTLESAEYAVNYRDSVRAKSATLVGAPLQLEIGLEKEPQEEIQPAAIPVEDLQVGQLIWVEAGELVPVDCTVISGSARVLERKLSGHTRLRVKGKGQPLFAGSEVERGRLRCRVEVSQQDSVLFGFLDQLEHRLTSLRSSRGKVTPILNGLLIFASFCAGIYWYESEASLLFIEEVMVSVLLIGSLPVAYLLIQMVPELRVVGAFKKGLFISKASFLEKISEIKSLVLDFVPDRPLGVPQIERFELLDERLERASLCGALLSLFGGSPAEIDRQATDYISKKVEENSPLYEVSDYHSYSGKGISAVVEGYEFSIGTEEFLIERGVFLQPGELGQEKEGAYIYIAIGEEVVARLHISEPFYADAHSMLDLLSSTGIRTLLWSQGDAEKIDSVGTRAGFELVNVSGGLSENTFVEKLHTLESPAVVSSHKPFKKLEQLHIPIISFFDELRWNVQEGDALILRQDLTGFGAAMKWLHRSQRLGAILGWSGGILSLGLLFGAVAGFLPPLIVGFSSLAGVVFLQGVYLLFAEK